MPVRVEGATSFTPPRSQDRNAALRINTPRDTLL